MIQYTKRSPKFEAHKWINDDFDFDKGIFINNPKWLQDEFDNGNLKIVKCFIRNNFGGGNYIEIDSGLFNDLDDLSSTFAIVKTEDIYGFEQTETKYCSKFCRIDDYITYMDSNIDFVKRATFEREYMRC